MDSSLFFCTYHGCFWLHMQKASVILVIVNPGFKVFCLALSSGIAVPGLPFGGSLCDIPVPFPRRDT